MFALMLCALCVFFMSRASVPVWQVVPGLAKIQFSTRWLSIFSLGVALSVAAGFQVYSIRVKGWRLALKLGHMTVAFAAGMATLFVILGSCFLGEQQTRMARDHLYNAPEYNPRSMVHWQQRVIDPYPEKCRLLEGTARIEILAWKSVERRVVVDASSPVTVKLCLLEYPGWEVRLDRQPITPGADPADGGMTVLLPEGRHELHLRFVNTWWRNAALAISGLVTVAVAGVWSTKGKFWCEAS
jgi:hypothetical protein